MAFDGSFRLQSELERFLERCPKLKLNPSFDNLLKKGEKIIDKTVGLLHLVPSLRSDEDNYMEEFDEDGFLRESESVECSEIASVIDVYVRRGKGLRLHELACVAFCRALDLIPFLSGSISNYFKVAPAPFERIIQCRSVSKALATGPNLFLNVVRASYRFLILEPEVFTKKWDCSCILDLLQQATDLTQVKDTFLRNILLDLRWCCVGISMVVLKLSFRASAKLGLDSKEAFQCFLCCQDFLMDASLEKGGWYLEASAEENGGVCSLMAEETASSNQIGISTRNPFILTPIMSKSFEMVSLAVNQRWPVLLYGPAGGGKTALINYLAHGYGSRVLSIHMDEQIDGKTLLGTYVCTEQPGEFRWQPGSLTPAVLNGFWVVFEGIDQAPADILSILLPLLEGATTFSTGHGQAVRVSESFRLFSTVTSSNPDTSRFTEGRNSLGAVWRKVMIRPPSNQDLLNIVQQWYP